MPLVRPYCTVADVQRETKNSGPELDEWYAECVTRASRMVEEMCLRDFWFHDYSAEDYSVPRSRVLGEMVALPFPIITLTDLWVYADKLVGKTDNDVVAEDEYYFEVGSSFFKSEFGPFAAARFRAGRFHSYNEESSDEFRGFMVLRGTFGYELAETNPDTTPPPLLPSEVRRATTLIAAAISDEMHKEQTGMDGSTVEILDTRIPTEAKTLLKRWRELLVTTF